jgi:SM-20-related protein
MLARLSFSAGSAAMVRGNNATDRPRGPDLFEEIALAIAERGRCVTPDFLPPLHVAQLRHEVQTLWSEGAFRHAGIGRGANLQIRPEVRSDRVHWLDPADCTGAQRLYFAALDGLRETLNRMLLLGLFEFEGHLAVYPPGSRYRRHLDQFRGVELRTLTAVLYLNQEWGAEDGGALRLFTDPRDYTRFEDISPLGGQLVTFLSARFLHEVLPARRERMSITGWFKRRGERPL